MPEAADQYQRSIDQAAKVYVAAGDFYAGIRSKIDAIPADERSTGGAREGEYAALSKQLDEAARRFTEAENAYQRAIQLQDQARATAKTMPAAGTRRTRLDNAGGQVVAITETADGSGGWSYDTSTPPSRVQIEGVTPAATRVTAGTNEQYIVSMDSVGNLTQKPNPNYVAPKPDAADRPPAPTVNTSAPKIPVLRNGEYVWEDNPNYRPPGSDQTAGQRAVDTATATTAGPAAETALQTAQTNAKKAQAELEDAQRRARQSPTDQQAQAAIQAAVQSSQLANQQLEAAIKQAGALNPIAVQQAQATLAQTQQNVAKGLQGDLYGRREQLQQIRDLLASGDIKPEEADAMSSALNRGTTVYQAMQQAQVDRQAARTQDVSNKNALAGNFASTFTGGLSTLSEMNKYAPVGSTKGADAFVALLNMSQQRLKDYEVAPAQATNYLGPLQPSPVGSMVNAAQQQMSTAQPQTNAQQPITINIGSGAASQPQAQPLLQPGQAGTASDPHAQPYQGGGPMSTSGDMLARSAAQQTPATNAEVLTTLFPNMAKRFGLLAE